MTISFTPLGVGATVAFGEYAYRVAMNRFGHYEIVLHWHELQALACGVEKSVGPEQAHARLLEGLKHFAQRQRLRNWPT